MLQKAGLFVLLGIGFTLGSLAAVSSAAVSSQEEPVLLRNRPFVRQVQEALARRGFDPGPADGIMGPRTRQAVRDYQRSEGLPENGQLTDETVESLGVDVSVNNNPDRRDRGLVGSVASGTATVGKTVGRTTAKGASAVAGGTATGAKATAKGATTGAKATAKGATVGAKATAKGTSTGAKAAAKGTTTAAKSTASAVETGAEATVGGAKAVGEGAGKALRGTKNFLFGKDQDKALEKEVREAFEARGIDPDHIGIQVDDSVVTLTFKAGTSSEWNRAVAIAKRVEGVSQVYVRKPAS